MVRPSYTLPRGPPNISSPHLAPSLPSYHNIIDYNPWIVLTVQPSLGDRTEHRTPSPPLSLPRSAPGPWLLQRHCPFHLGQFIKSYFGCLPASKFMHVEQNLCKWDKSSTLILALQVRAARIQCAVYANPMQIRASGLRGEGKKSHGLSEKG